MQIKLSWPPSFILRRSPKARHVRLQICRRRGLQLILPRNFNTQKIPEILQKHRNWIERTWSRLQPLALNAAQEILPQQIHLVAINEIWQIHYQWTETVVLNLEVNANKQLSIRGNIKQELKVKTLLCRWLLLYAQQQLIPWLKQLSEKTTLHYSRASVRNNIGRWGSCSSKKHISLNCKLLFLPPELTEHILLHELCHTIHLNHSQQFWNLLEKINPDCHQLRHRLKQAQQFMPYWLE